MLQTLPGKQKYQVTNVGVEKIKLSRLLVQRINEFKIKEIQRKGRRTLADFLSQSCRFFVGLKFVGTSACRTLADFLS